jgi:hypothetical protein
MVAVRDFRLHNIAVKSTAATVDEYLAGLPADRHAAISAVRDVILKNLGSGAV